MIAASPAYSKMPLAYVETEDKQMTAFLSFGLGLVPDIGEKTNESSSFLGEFGNISDIQSDRMRGLGEFRFYVAGALKMLSKLANDKPLEI